MKTDQEMVRWALEESSEPVIKNPYLVGTPTKEVTQHGRRIYETPEGEEVSEKSTTFFLNGLGWINIPSIHGGRAFNDDQLRGMIKRGEIQPTSVHQSKPEAEEAAGSRSNMMKRHEKGFAGGQLVQPGPGRQGYALSQSERTQKYLKTHPEKVYQKKGFAKSKELVKSNFKNFNKFLKSGQTLDDFYDLFKDPTFKLNLRTYLKGEAGAGITGAFDDLNFKTKYKNIIPKITEYLEVWHDYEQNPNKIFKTQRKKDLVKKYSDLHTENMISKAKRVKKTDYVNQLDLAHRQDLIIDQNISELGIEKPEINRVLIKDAELERNKLHRKNFALVDEIKKGNNVEKNLRFIKENNARITKIAEITKGRLTGITINPDTLEAVKLKPSNVVAADAGILNKSIKNLSPDDKKILKTKILPQMIEEARAMTPQKIAADLSGIMQDEVLSKKLETRMKNLKQGKQITKPVFKQSQATYKILKNMGYGKGCKASGGRVGFAEGDAVTGEMKCIMNDVEKTRADLKSSNVEVRAKALTKQRNALKIASKIPQIGKIIKTGIQMGTSAITTPLKALGLTSGIGYAIEGIVEGGFYDNARRKGYTHEQAFAETFSPRLIKEGVEGKSTKDVPWYGGAETLLEQELIGDPKQNPKVAQYVDALKEQDRIYDLIRKKEVLKDQPTTTDETLFIPGDLAAASTDVHDLARSGAYRRVDQTLKPESMAAQAYETAVERQKGKQDQRRREYLEKYDPGALKYEERTLSTPRQLEKRYEAMEEKYPTYSREQLEDLLEAWGTNTPWDVGFASGVKGYDEMGEWLKTHDKYKTMEAGVANVAEGGIIGLLKK